MKGGAAHGKHCHATSRNLCFSACSGELLQSQLVGTDLGSRLREAV